MVIQEHAANNERLRAFLDRKGDEHIFSLLYFIGGIACLIAAFGHGNDFCTGPSSTLETAVSSSVRGEMSVKQHQLATMQRVSLEGVDEKSINRTNPAEENVITAAWNRLQASLKLPAVKERHSPPTGDEDTGTEVLQAALSDLVTGNETKAEQDITDAPTQAFLGPAGLVVLWLKVEGFTALGLPLVSIIMLAKGLHEVLVVSCLLYLVAVFQAFWLILGCVWAFGGFVPAECRSGALGDHVAFNVLWWVCGVWLGTMGVMSLVITVMVCFLASSSALDSASRPHSGRGGYARVEGQEHSSDLRAGTYM